MSGNCGALGGEICMEKCAGNFEGMRTFGRPMPRWEDNIQMDLEGRGRDTVDWIHLDEDGKSGGLL